VSKFIAVCELDEDEAAGEYRDDDDNVPYEWCDECDAELAEGEGNGVWDIPDSLMYKDAGESAVVCDKCLVKLGWVLNDYGDVVGNTWDD
jgi:hypothetical protein